MNQNLRDSTERLRWIRPRSPRHALVLVLVPVLAGALVIYAGLGLIALPQALDERDAAIAAVATAAAEKRAATDRLADDLAAAELEAQELAEKLAQMEARFAAGDQKAGSVVAENRALADRLAELQAEADRLTADLAAAETDRDAENERANELVTEIRALSDKLAAAEARAADAATPAQAWATLRQTSTLVVWWGYDIPCTEAHPEVKGDAFEFGDGVKPTRAMLEAEADKLAANQCGGETQVLDAVEPYEGIQRVRTDQPFVGVQGHNTLTHGDAFRAVPWGAISAGQVPAQILHFLVVEGTPEVAE